MNKKLNEMTTEDLLFIESIGGIISDGIIPKPLTESNSLPEWRGAMPLVDERLLQVYYQITVNKRVLAEIAREFSN